MSPTVAFVSCPRCGERHAPIDSHRPPRLIEVLVEGVVRRCPYCYCDWTDWLGTEKKAS
jgi:hypothetical protein